jgi:hypothetical protein
MAQYSLSPSNDIEDHDVPLRPSDNFSDEPPIDVSPEELKELRKWEIILRVSFMICAIAMGIIAFFSFASTSLGDFFVALYVLFFSVIICCYECALTGVSRWIAQNFGFMYTRIGRIVFILYVAVLCIELGVFGIVVCSALVLAIAVNIYVYYKQPKYAAWIRHKHLSAVASKK